MAKIDPPQSAFTAPAAPRQLQLLLAGVVILAAAALLWPRSAGSPAKGGFLVDSAGRPAPLADHLAPVTLLHFWATWCPPCIQEGPALQRLIRDLAPEQRFQVVMVAVQDDARKAQRLAGPIADQLLFDPQWDVAHRYGTSQLPESYLLVGGKVQRVFHGAVDWDDAGVRAAIQQLILKQRRL